MADGFSDDSVKPVVLVGPLEGSFLASFALGWGVTTGAGLASYPLDTIRRRMMMTSGGTVHYKSMFDAGSQIVAKEGVRSLFKGAGANILRGVAGAGVLSLYDKLQELMFGKVYSVSVMHLNVPWRSSLTWLSGWLWINVTTMMSFIQSLETFLLLPNLIYTVSTQPHIVTFLVSGFGTRVMQMFPIALVACGIQRLRRGCSDGS